MKLDPSVPSQLLVANLYDASQKLQVLQGTIWQLQVWVPIKKAAPPE